MADLNLRIIAEKINDSVPGTHKLFEADDFEGIVNLAIVQANEGAAYIDVNIGPRSPELMAKLVRRIQEVVSVPLCIDSPDFEIQKAGLEAYDREKAGGQMPLLNSISELRMEFIELAKIEEVKFIILCTESSVNGELKTNETGEEIFAAGLRVSAAIKKKCAYITNDDLFFDPGMGPLGADMSGTTKATIDAVKLIHESEDLRGCHMSVGLSNFSVQLPSRTASGDLVKTPLESAFLTLTNPQGMDHVIGSTKKKYKSLEDNHPALLTVQEVLKLEGFDRIMKVQEFYS
ncbi:MAG: dihydropteroate synthase [bacterium]|nr:dihydropteroate synthase [bacterium]